jgi:hypothetical protein
VLVRQLAEEMKLKKIAKTEMATKMQTSQHNSIAYWILRKQVFRLIRFNGPRWWWVVNCALS